LLPEDMTLLLQYLLPEDSIKKKSEPAVLPAVLWSTT